MSINTNRARLNKANDNQEYHRIFLQWWFPPYWDEMYYRYPTYRKGFKNSNKGIFSYQRREYRTWKHTRKTQWK